MSWDHEKYFVKAQRYWTRATSMERDSDQFLLQVSFFCEFFIRGCLVSHNPVLNAEIEEESIIYASGIPSKRPPRTISMETAVQRVQRLILEITESEAKTASALFKARNAELHSDTDDISDITNSEVLPNILSLIVKLAQFAGQDLDVMMGKHEAAQARNTASAVSKDRKTRVRNLINTQKDRFFSLPEEEQKQLREKARPSFQSAVMKSGHHIKTQKCPSCAELGLLAGIPVGRSAPILQEEGIIEEVRVQPEVFNCKCCDLKIKGLDELMAAGFPHEFVTLADMDPVEYFGIDPMEYVNTDEIIREYHSDMYEYQDE